LEKVWFARHSDSIQIWIKKTNIPIVYKVCFLYLFPHIFFYIYTSPRTKEKKHPPFTQKTQKSKMAKDQATSSLLPALQLPLHITTYKYISFPKNSINSPSLTFFSHSLRPCIVYICICVSIYPRACRLPWRISEWVAYLFSSNMSNRDKASGMFSSRRNLGPS
jgi:hypothetical protein